MTAGIAVHMGLALAGDAAFVAAGASGLAYLSCERRLKAKDPAFLRAGGSSLETLDRLNLWALWLGFILFTLGLLDGLRLARLPAGQAGGGQIGIGDPKTVFTLATWGAYAALLGVRTTTIARGPKVAALSVACLALVGLTFVGAKYLGSQHGFF